MALTVRQSIWCWPTGLVQVSLYVYVFYAARLYSDMVLHAIYVVLQFYGWYHWRYGGASQKQPLPVTRINAMQALGWSGAIAIVAFGWGEIMHRYTDAAAPYADAFIAAASLCAQYLMARKVLENWIVWIVVDLVAIAVYWSRDLKPTAGLYLVFLVLCIAGVFSWYRSFAEKRDHVVPELGSPA